MDRRAVVRTVFEGGRPPYVPWQFAFTAGAREKLAAVLGPADLEAGVGNHMLMLRRSAGAFTDLGGGLVRDIFGVVWDRRMDADVGFPSGDVLPRPSLAGLELPDPADPRFFLDWDRHVATAGDRFRVFSASFSLYERAWSMRGLENLLMDFYDHPGFVHDLLERAGRLQHRAAPAGVAVWHRGGLVRRRLGPAAWPPDGSTPVGRVHPPAGRPDVRGRA